MTFGARYNRVPESKPVPSTPDQVESWIDALFSASRYRNIDGGPWHNPCSFDVVQLTLYTSTDKIQRRHRVT